MIIDAGVIGFIVEFIGLLPFRMDIVFAWYIFTPTRGAVSFHLGFSATYCSFSFCSHSTVTFHAHLTFGNPIHDLLHLHAPLPYHPIIAIYPVVVTPLLIRLSCTYRYTAEHTHFTLSQSTC